VPIKLQRPPVKKKKKRRREKQIEKELQIWSKTNNTLVAISLDSTVGSC
jgi:hypothetical protein